MFRILCVFSIVVLAEDVVLAQNTQIAQNIAVEAHEWDELLQNPEGWLAADGIYSVQIPNTKKILFLFSDTLVGTTRNDGQDFDHFRLVNHSMALMDGNSPEKSRIRFLYDENRNLLGYRCWLQDGTIFKGRLWMSGLIFDSKTWKPERVDAVSVGLKEGGIPDFADVKIDTTAPLSKRIENMQAVFGCAILENSEEDGYTYVYGYLDHFLEMSRKDLIVARVKEEKFDDFSAWEFYDGTAWHAEMDCVFRDRAGLTRGVSPELSVSQIPSGPYAERFLLVYTPGGISPQLAYRVGETPVGPFSKPVVFYTSDVPTAAQNAVQCYNGKGHPALSTDEALLVSYNVNRLGALAKRPSEYRPCFVWLKYADLTVRE